MTLQTDALILIHAFNRAFQKSKVGRYEEIRLQEGIDQTLRSLEKSQKVDNKLLIALEKFHQSTSFLVGVTGLSITLSDEVRQAWRAYDKWHYDNVKPNLHLYAPIFGPM